MADVEEAEQSLATMILEDYEIMEALRRLGRIREDEAMAAKDRIWQRVKAGLRREGGRGKGETARPEDADARLQSGRPDNARASD